MHIAYAIKDAIERCGAARDFMTGNEPYEYEWADAETRVLDSNVLAFADCRSFEIHGLTAANRILVAAGKRCASVARALGAPVSARASSPS